jgi:hypothetical protein
MLPIFEGSTPHHQPARNHLGTLQTWRLSFSAPFYYILLPKQNLYSVNLNEVQIMLADGISIKKLETPTAPYGAFPGHLLGRTAWLNSKTLAYGWEAKVSGLGRRFLNGLLDSAQGKYPDGCLRSFALQKKECF